MRVHERTGAILVPKNALIRAVHGYVGEDGFVTSKVVFSGNYKGVKRALNKLSPDELQHTEVTVLDVPWHASEHDVYLCDDLFSVRGDEWVERGAMGFGMVAP